MRALLLAVVLVGAAACASAPTAPVESDERPVGRVDPRTVADATPGPAERMSYLRGAPARAISAALIGSFRSRKQAAE